MNRRLKIKCIAAQRYFYWHYLSGVTRNVRITEFPRSGGTWLARMLSELLQIPFPQKAFIPFAKSIEHAHYSGPVDDKTIIMMRDGRDVLTSAYFHFLYYSEKKPKHLVDKWRSLMGEVLFEEVDKNLEHFIRVFSNEFKVGGKRVSWSDHVLSFDRKNPKVHFVKYEDLLATGAPVLDKICMFLNIVPSIPTAEIIDKYSFKNITQRLPGHEDRSNFYRKGIAGDWKNYFNNDTLTTFNQLHGYAMKEWGYD